MQAARTIGDSTYHSGNAYDLLEAQSIEPIIKPRRNSRLDTGHAARRRTMERYRQLGHEA